MKESPYCFGGNNPILFNDPLGATKTLTEENLLDIIGTLWNSDFGGTWNSSSPGQATLFLDNSTALNFGASYMVDNSAWGTSTYANALGNFYAHSARGQSSKISSIRYSFGRGSYRTTLNYDPLNKRWNDKDGNAYTGRTNKFADIILADLKKNQENILGNLIVNNLSSDTKIHHIIKGDINTNGTDKDDIYYSGAESNDGKILENVDPYYAEGYVALGHEMAHKFDKNMGIENVKWFGSDEDKKGVDEYNGMYYENVLRQANGLKRRMYYDQGDGFRGQILDASGKLMPLPEKLRVQKLSLPLIHVSVTAIMQMFLGF